MGRSAETRVKCDVGGIQAAIRQVGDRAVKGVSGVMRDYGEIIAHQARMNAPRDTGALEGAISVKMDRDANNRLVVRVYVSRIALHESGKNVADYAWEMERGLAPFGSGDYHAREGTLAKGSQAGGRFLERAVQEHRQALLQRARRIVKRVVG